MSYLVSSTSAVKEHIIMFTQVIFPLHKKSNLVNLSVLVSSLLVSNLRYSMGSMIGATKEAFC